LTNNEATTEAAITNKMNNKATTRST
jgi:hypothetical protein